MADGEGGAGARGKGTGKRQQPAGCEPVTDGEGGDGEGAVGKGTGKRRRATQPHRLESGGPERSARGGCQRKARPSVREKRRSGSREREEAARRREGSRASGEHARENSGGAKTDPRLRRPRPSNPKERACGAERNCTIERLGNGEVRSDGGRIRARERGRSDGPEPAEARSDAHPFSDDVDARGAGLLSRNVYRLILDLFKCGDSSLSR